MRDTVLTSLRKKIIRSTLLRHEGLEEALGSPITVVLHLAREWKYSSTSSLGEQLVTSQLWQHSKYELSQIAEPHPSTYSLTAHKRPESVLYIISTQQTVSFTGLSCARRPHQPQHSSPSSNSYTANPFLSISNTTNLLYLIKDEPTPRFSLHSKVLPIDS
jgi:hypothetical protein